MGVIAALPENKKTASLGQGVGAKPMRIMRSVWLAVVLLVPTLVAGAHAEAVNATAWGFSATFPCQSNVGSQVIKSDLGQMVLTFYGCGTDTEAYIVAVNDFPPGLVKPELVDNAYAGAINGVAESDKSTIRSVAPYTLGTITGREAVLDSADGKQVSRLRVFMTGDRLYQVLYVGQRGSEDGRICLDFMNSFAITVSAKTASAAPK